MITFKEALKLFESKEFNDYDSLLFSDYYELNKSTYDNKTDAIKYTEPSEYEDDTGEKWRYVKKRDFTTVALAVIDGMCDSGRLPADMYKNIRCKAELDKITMNVPAARRLINNVWGYLQRVLDHGRVKVYRGFNIPAKLYDELPLKDKLGASLLNRFSNAGKHYNSYSLDINVADSFATGNALGNRRLKEDTYAIIIEGDAELSDISFAYTAYLVGKHGNLNESELNINCFKPLTNQNIHSIRKVKYVNGAYIVA